MTNLLHLSRNGQRKLVDEANVGSDLVVSDTVTAEVADVVLRACFARSWADPGTQFLPHSLVGYADHLGVGYFGVRVQEVLDLARVDILAASDHHVFDPPDRIAV